MLCLRRAQRAWEQLSYETSNDGPRDGLNEKYPASLSVECLGPSCAHDLPPNRAFVASIRLRVEELERCASNSLNFQLGRFLFRRFREFIRVEPMDREKRRVGARLLTSSTLPAHIKYPAWSLVNLVLLVASTLHVTWNLYHQYRLDFSLLKMNHLLERAGLRTVHQLAIIERLNATVNEQRHLLDLSGTPCVRLAFVIEVLYWLQLAASVIAYLLPQVYMRRIGDMNTYVSSIFIHYEHHLVVCHLHVQEQVARYLASSRNFQRILSGGLATKRVDSSSEFDIVLSIQCHRDNMKETRRALHCCRALEKQLHLMVANNQLLPASSTPRWIASWIPWVVALTIICFIYGLLFDLYFVYMLFFDESIGCKDHQQPRLPTSGRLLVKVVLVVESIILLLPLNCSSVCQGVVFMGLNVDMLRSANHLRARIRQFIVANNQQLDLVRKATRGRDQLVAEWADQANCQLLELFMHYKIFLRQLKALQKFFSAFVWTCMALTMCGPIIARLHTPYCDNDQAVKTFFIVLSIFVVAPATLCLVPPCCFHRRCQDLSKSLMYLAAHIVRVHGRASTRHFYERHLVLVLQREIGLLSGETAPDQFAIDLGPTSLSFTSLLEFYFWFGLVTMSIVVRSDSGQAGSGSRHQSLGGLFRDPFGVYS